MTIEDARRLSEKFNIPISAEGYYVCNVCGEEWSRINLEEWDYNKLEAFLRGNGCPECV